jgi:hypothetical protein
MTRTFGVVKGNILANICNCYIAIARPSQVTPDVMIMQLWVGHLELGLSVFKLILICCFFPADTSFHWLVFYVFMNLNVQISITLDAKHVPPYYGLLELGSAIFTKPSIMLKPSWPGFLELFITIFLLAGWNGYTTMTQSSGLGSDTTSMTCNSILCNGISSVPDSGYISLLVVGTGISTPSDTKVITPWFGFEELG